MAQISNAELFKLFEKNIKTVEENTRELAQLRAQTEASRKLLLKIKESSSESAFKLSSHELRFCELRGEGTDAARMAESWCSAESALLSSNTLRVAVETIVDQSSSRAIEYDVIFKLKDISRGEFVAASWWLTFEKNEILEGNDSSMGRVGQLMPSFRAKCAREFEHQKNRGMHIGIESTQEFLDFFPSCRGI